MTLSGTDEEKLAFLDEHAPENARLAEGARELRTVIEALPSLGVAKENFAIDLTIARGLDYYTGTVYETVVNSHRR